MAQTHTTEPAHLTHPADVFAQYPHITLGEDGDKEEYGPDLQPFRHGEIQPANEQHWHDDGKAEQRNGVDDGSGRPGKYSYWYKE